MQIDVLGQLLVPGDFLVHHGYRSLEFGVYVGQGGNGSIHVQSVYVDERPGNPYGSVENILARYREILLRARNRERFGLSTVSWPARGNKVLRVAPEALREDIRELLDTIRELCIIKRKLRYDSRAEPTVPGTGSTV